MWLKLTKHTENENTNFQFLLSFKMLPFKETKKRKIPERLNMQQKQWICEQQLSEPTITEKNLNIEEKMA